MTLFPLELIWTVTLEPALSAAPAFDDNQVYLPLASGQFGAYRLKDGVRRWLEEQAASADPAAGDDLVFVPSASAITARHAADGTVAWQIAVKDIGGPLVWKSGWLLVPTAGGDVRALRATDGVEVWHTALGSAPHARLTVFGDRVYVPTADGRVVALDITSGERAWERRLDGAANEISAAADRIYVGSVDNFLYCLDARDGSVMWRWRTGADVIGAPALDAGHVYFVSLDNVLRALNRHSGVQRWMRPLDVRPASGPLATEHLLTISGRSPSLNAFRLSDGRPGGSLTAAGDLAAPPHLFADPAQPMPLLLILTGNSAGGTTMSAYSRAIEPRIVPVAPLPNLVKIGSGRSSAETEPEERELPVTPTPQEPGRSDSRDSPDPARR